jgi:hypothetical protein
VKIAVSGHGANQDHLDGFGGLEQRFGVNWAHFLRTEGHEVHFFDINQGTDSSFDLAIDCPIEKCHHIKARRHIHGSFNPISLCSRDVQDNPCYQEGKYLYSNPYRTEYLKSLGMSASGGFKHTPVFMPLPYPDDLLPVGMQTGFARSQIAWSNKGNFHPAFTREFNYHLIEDGIKHLKALVRLNQRADFKITFLLDSMIRNTGPEWRAEVEGLIAQLKQVERLETIPWSQLVQLLGRCKLNTHVGSLTSSVNETVFTYGIPVTPAGFGHLATVDLLPPHRESTVEQVYDTYERLWFDEKFYHQIRDAFQDTFRDHRTEAVRKAWKDLIHQLDLE